MGAWVNHIEEWNKKVAALNLKSTLAFRSLVVEKEYMQASRYVRDLEDDYKKKIKGLTGKALVETMESMLDHLRRQNKVVGEWALQSSIFGGYVDHYGLRNDPEVDWKYLNELLNS